MSRFSAWLAGVFKGSAHELELEAGTGATITATATARRIKYTIGVSGGGGGTTDHAALSHLDYASSGHTGFQPAGSYQAASSQLTALASLSPAAQYQVPMSGPGPGFGWGLGTLGEGAFADFGTGAGDVCDGDDVRLMHGYGRWEIGVADGNTVVSYGAPSVTVVATGAVATSTITNTYYSLAFAVTDAGKTGGVRTSTATYRMGHNGKIWFRFATDASIASSHFWIGASVSLGTAATPANDTAAINYDSSIGGGAVYVASYSAATGLITRVSTGVTLAPNTEYYGYIRTTSTGVYGKIAVVGTALPAAETASTTNLPAAGSNMYPVMYFIRDAAGTVTYHFLRMTMEYLCV